MSAITVTLRGHHADYYKSWTEYCLQHPANCADPAIDPSEMPGLYAPEREPASNAAGESGGDDDSSGSKRHRSTPKSLHSFSRDCFGLIMDYLGGNDLASLALTSKPLLRRVRDYFSQPSCSVGRRMQQELHMMRYYEMFYPREKPAPEWLTTMTAAAAVDDLGQQIAIRTARAFLNRDLYWAGAGIPDKSFETCFFLDHVIMHLPAALRMVTFGSVEVHRLIPLLHTKEIILKPALLEKHKHDFWMFLAFLYVTERRSAIFYGKITRPLRAHLLNERASRVETRFGKARLAAVRASTPPAPPEFPTDSYLRLRLRFEREAFSQPPVEEDADAFSISYLVFFGKRVSPMMENRGKYLIKKVQGDPGPVQPHLLLLAAAQQEDFVILTMKQEDAQVGTVFDHRSPVERAKLRPSFMTVVGPHPGSIKIIMNRSTPTHMLTSTSTDSDSNMVGQSSTDSSERSLIMRDLSPPPLPLLPFLIGSGPTRVAFVLPSVLPLKPTPSACTLKGISRAVFNKVEGLASGNPVANYFVMEEATPDYELGTRLNQSILLESQSRPFAANSFLFSGHFTMGMLLSNLFNEKTGFSRAVLSKPIKNPRPGPATHILCVRFNFDRADLRRWLHDWKRCGAAFDFNTAFPIDAEMLLKQTTYGAPAGGFVARAYTTTDRYQLLSSRCPDHSPSSPMQLLKLSQRKSKTSAKLAITSQREFRIDQDSVGQLQSVMSQNPPPAVYQERLFRDSFKAAGVQFTRKMAESYEFGASIAQQAEQPVARAHPINLIDPEELGALYASLNLWIRAWMEVLA